MSNADARLKGYRDRLINIEKEKRAAADAMKDMIAEMKGKVTPDEIAGIKIAVRRAFEVQGKRERREAAEHVADQLALAL